MVQWNQLAPVVCVWAGLESSPSLSIEIVFLKFCGDCLAIWSYSSSNINRVRVKAASEAGPLCDHRGLLFSLTTINNVDFIAGLRLDPSTQEINLACRDNDWSVVFRNLNIELKTLEATLLIIYFCSIVVLCPILEPDHVTSCFEEIRLGNFNV